RCARARGVPLARSRALVSLHLGKRSLRRARLRRLRRPWLTAARLRTQRARALVVLPLRRVAPPAVGAAGRHALAGLAREHRAAGRARRRAGRVQRPSARVRAQPTDPRGGLRRRRDGWRRARARRGRAVLPARPRRAGRVRRAARRRLRPPSRVPLRDLRRQGARHVQSELPVICARRPATSVSTLNAQVVSGSSPLPSAWTCGNDSAGRCVTAVSAPSPRLDSARSTAIDSATYVVAFTAP